MKGPTNESVVNVMLSSGVRRVFPFKVYAWRSGLYGLSLGSYENSKSFSQ